MSPPGTPAAPAAVPVLPAPRWTLRSPPQGDAVDRLQEGLRLPRPLCAVLAVRGLVEASAARSFLRPLLSELHGGDGLAGAAEAVDRIVLAIRTGETILVHGDYDVDGIAGAALYARWLGRLGARVVAFVPHRLRDGYDFGAAGLAEARRAGASLVLTADCGIRAHEAVAAARDAGIDVVITDHHAPDTVLPPAVAVVNPSRPDCGYRHAALSGAGVAYQVCRLLARAFGVPDEELLPHLDLVALATVADLVPLEGDNRILVRYGLRALQRTEKPGLRALLDRTGLGASPLEAGQVGFILAPRINAAGRVADAAAALRLLMTEDESEARTLAERLEEENRVRREEDRRTLDEALEALAEGYRPDTDFGVVLAREGWHPGVIGIVASRVVERIHRPTVLVALDGDRGRGSARSIPGFHLYGALEACAGFFDRFGGHAQAAGMDLAASAIPAFREAFNEEARRTLGDTELRPSLTVDLEIGLAEVTADLGHYLRYLGPFGVGNPRPVFLARRLAVVDTPRVVGADHLKMRLGEDGVFVDAIGFRLADRLPPDQVGSGPVDAVFHVHEDEYRGRKRVQARLLDLRPSSGAS